METNHTVVLEPCGSSIYVIYKLRKMYTVRRNAGIHIWTT